MKENNSLVLDNVRDLQKIVLGILLDVAEFCKKNDLRFYMSEGSLLGTIRHKGFIPWDDDVDIMMPREDYEKFLKIAPAEMKGKYEIQHFSTFEKCWFGITKVRLITDEPQFRQENVAHLTENNGPLIDIFPLDTVPKKQSFGQDMNRRIIGLYKIMLIHKSGAYVPPAAEEKKKLPRKIMSTVNKVLVKIMLPFVTVRGLHKKLHKRFIKYNNSNNKFYINWGSWYGARKETFPKEQIGEPVWVSFEDYEMPVPADYHSVLTNIYGDYMTPPPQYLQFSKHHFNENNEGENKE